MLKKFLFAATCLLLLASSFSVSNVCSGKRKDLTFTRNLEIFNDLASKLELYYVDSIRTDEAFKAAIDAMLNTIDPYTEYFDQNDTQSLQLMTTGSYGGIGAFVLSRGNDTYISEPIPDAPAHKAGLRAGDRIVSVDSVAVSGMPTDKVTALLKGQPGTKLSVTVIRPYVTDSIVTVDMTREKVQEKSVPYYGVLNGNTGYISLSSYIDKSPQEVRKALEEFKSNPEVKQLILDLRGNGGGLVESAVEILGNFLPKGTEVLRTRGKSKDSEKVYKTTHSPLLPDIPMVVIIDGGSASASEITAGALQDLDRAVLLGSNSFGKGLVQGTFPLPYDALLKVTMAKYYTPSGRLLQALDYSRRNADGTVARTPDSLTHVYKTLHGREVRDGGGLMPDSVIKWQQPSRLLYELVIGNRIFDFANRYAAENPSIGNPLEFTVSDSLYRRFVETLDTIGIKPDRSGTKMIASLRELADAEGYMSPQLEAHLDSVRTLLTPDLMTDLYSKQDEISAYIAEEIASRYYLAGGRKAAELRTDPGVAAAIAILENPELYNRILGYRR